MYIIKRFLGDEFEEFNSLTSSYSRDQNSYINLAACISYPFQEVLDVLAMPLHTLPTEGTVGNRFFPICRSLDEIEKYAEELAIKLFHLDQADYRVSVQPNSGTQANQIIYNAVLKDRDIVLSMDPKDGGHISHTKMGCRNITVKYYRLDKHYEIDYDYLEKLVQTYQPKLIIVGASSYSKEFDYEKISKITAKYGTLLMADICHSVLYIAGQVHKSIFPFVDFATFTMDKTLRGPQGGVLLYRSCYDKVISQSIFPKTQGGPVQSMMFAKAMCFLKLSSINLNAYAKQVVSNANLLIRVLNRNHVQTVTPNTMNHILLINLSNTSKTGREMEKILFDYGIIANRNQIPDDCRNAFVTSGIRMGTVGITNLGYLREDIEALGNYISTVITASPVNPETLQSLIDKYHRQINISN